LIRRELARIRKLLTRARDPEDYEDYEDLVEELDDEC